jgi:hypothetical protein
MAETPVSTPEGDSAMTRPPDSRYTSGIFRLKPGAEYESWYEPGGASSVNVPSLAVVV